MTVLYRLLGCQMLHKLQLGLQKATEHNKVCPGDTFGHLGISTSMVTSSHPHLNQLGDTFGL